MRELRTAVKATIWGTKDAWSLVRSTATPEPSPETDVLLTIQGNAREGFHLVQSPEGFFTADSWHPTLEDAFESARELFGVNREAWRE